MSLAATLAADGLRPASFLPAIKCSNCGDEIEIARMGDHVCGNRQQFAPSPVQQPRQARPSPPALSNPYTMPSWGTGNQQYQPPSPTSHSPVNSRMPTAAFVPSPLAQTQSPPQVAQPHPSALLPAHAQSTQSNARSLPAALLPGQSDPLRATKLPLPPRINPDAANKPFLAPSYPRSASPSSPVQSTRSGRSGSSNGSRPPALRNMTMPSPLTRNRSPSPDLASNLDCAFPSFPVTNSNPNSRPGTSNGRHTPNSDKAPSRAGSRAGLRPQKEATALESKSPRTNAGESIMKRAGTLKSGPFDAGRRTGSRDEKSMTPPLPTTTTPLPRRPSDFGEQPHLDRKHSDLRRPSESGRRPSNFTGRDDFRPPSPPSGRDESPPPADFFAGRGRSSRPPTSNGQNADVPAPLNVAGRSNTFSETSDMPALARVPSETEQRGRGRVPSVGGTREQSRARDQFPIRSSSRSRTRVDYKVPDDAPPVPKPVQHYRHLSKHAPSESASSASTSSRSYSNANSSEGPSPVGSAASSIDAFSALSQANNYDKDFRPRSERMRSAGYSTKLEQKNPGLRAEAPAQRSPPPNFARPRPTNTSVSHGVMQSMAALVGAPVESRSPPARGEPIRQDSGWQSNDLPSRARTVSPVSQEQGSWASQQPRSLSRTVSPVNHTTTPPQDEWTPSWGQPPPKIDDYDPYRANSPVSTTRGRSKSNASSIYPTERAPSMPAPPIPANSLYPPSLQRRNTSAKAPCRGCKQIIEGKSVKASDGRLTGRWHKQCFVCQTCRQPFATADFYVINDQPYCKQHYHEQNGSLCFGCKRGIEGQYLETGASGPEKKYHPTCFTCHECRLILSNDYFEINGHAYCERHAMVAMRGQPRYGGAAGGYNRGGYGTPSGLHPGRRELMAERRTTRLMMM